MACGYKLEPVVGKPGHTKVTVTYYKTWYRWREKKVVYAGSDTVWYDITNNCRAGTMLDGWLTSLVDLHNYRITGDFDE